jgi:Altered inheritance of mitochondria protein 21
MLISLGTNDGLMSYPDEQIGYLASDQYSSRIASPAQGGGYLQKLHSNSSQPAIESQLRTTSFPTEVFQKSEFAESKGSISGKSEAIDSEVEEDVIHVDDPARRYNKVTGGEETIHETKDLGPNRSNTPDRSGYISENGYGVPILASDEVAKDSGSEHMQPAVSPKQERRGSAYLVADEFASGNITPTSRPSSRPVSIHGFNASLSRFMSRHEDREDIHTPLEDVDEYEPLFPDEDENHKGPVNAAERFKIRPGTLKHRFPSQDIWEDTPSSAMHVATVSTPDVPPQDDSVGASSASKIFEDPSAESARKGEVTEADKAKLIPKEERLAKSQFAPHLRDDMPTRPDMQQRFPSRDIWEDTPDSMHLVTTVASPPPPGDVPMSPENVTPSKPSIPPRPLNRSRLGESSTQPSVPAETEVKQPQVPARPGKPDFTVADANHGPPQASEKTISPIEGKKGPSLPDRPKPQVPIRPAKKESLEALTKTLSGASSGSQDTVTSQTLPKAKPAIPARPIASKPNLPAAFMSDLNQRLQLGPRPPIKEKEPEPEPEADKEVLPLSDARKGRARGPQRRAPAKPPSGPADTASSSFPKFSISSAKSLWSISEDNGLTFHSLEKSSASSHNKDPDIPAQDVDSKATMAASAGPADAPKPLAPASLALNAAGDSADPSPMGSGIATPGTEKSDPLSKGDGSLARDSKEASSSVSKQPAANTAAPASAQLGGAEAAKDEESDKAGITDSRTTGNGGSTASREQPQQPHTASDEPVSEGVLAADAGAELPSQQELTSSSLEEDGPE